MFSIVSSEEKFETDEVDEASLGAITNNPENPLLGETECESASIKNLSNEKEVKKIISVGDSLPYGIRLYYESCDNIVRLKDIGSKRRILLLGVVGSFTPYCWNRHLFRVLEKSRYYEERGIDYICCISTNDAFTQRAWSAYLGCDDSILMLSDASKRFTKAIGMDIFVPWLDENVRSRRYVIYAEDMVVSKMEVALEDGPDLSWECEHLRQEAKDEDEEDSDSDLWI